MSICRVELASLLAVLLLLASMVGCGGPPALDPEDPHWKDLDAKPIPEPEYKERSVAWDAVKRSTFDQVRQVLDIDRTVRSISGKKKQSWNINSFDEVPNSSWWTNRHYFSKLNADDLARGMVMNGGPDTTGTWTVFRPKVGGVTPGFWIKDRNGRAYILKFDGPGWPELNTGAAAMAGRFFHACGYNVPEETITAFYVDSLVIDDGVTYKDEDGVKQPFTRETLNEILEHVNVGEDGRVRCLASTLIPNVKGPFNFSGTRSDDPNDWCPREHRRELRALRVFCAFINHWDIKDANTIDSYVGEDGEGHLVHYLLDFGTTLGSGGYRAQQPWAGYTNFFDIKDAATSYVSLGLHLWPWEKAKPVEFPSVGYLEADLFEPHAWNPGYPLPAFENMTMRDAYWAAKIVMSFDEHDLRALIKSAQLSNPKAEEHLLEVLQARQRKIGEFYFARVNPLDNFELKSEPDQVAVTFDDLTVTYGFVTSSSTACEIRHGGSTVAGDIACTGNRFELQGELLNSVKAAYDDRGQNSDHLYQLVLTTERDGGSANAINLWLWYHPEDDQFQMVGIEHID